MYILTLGASFSTLFVGYYSGSLVGQEIPAEGFWTRSYASYAGDGLAWVIGENVIAGTSVQGSEFVYAVGIAAISAAVTSGSNKLVP